MHRLIAALFFMTLIGPVQAGDLESETADDGSFQWEIMFESAIQYDPTVLEIAEIDSLNHFVSGSFYLDVSYKGFFIQTDRHRTSTFSGELGYQLIERDDWGLDIIAKVYLHGFDPESIEHNNDKKHPGFEKLKDRNFGAGIALRYSYFDDDAYFSADLATLNPSGKNEGWLIDLYYSHLTVYQNWDIYSGVGLTYFSQEIVDYYAGVTEPESSAHYAVYQSGDGYKIEAQVFGLYPLSQSWAFTAGMTHSYYSSSFSQSPVGLRENVTLYKLGVRYVF